VLAVLLLCQILTVSRSGMLGTGAGILVVLGLHPQVARAPRFWLTLGVGLGAVLGLATFAGVNPGLLVWRLASSFDPGDLSSTTHLAVALYALGLIARYPLTGVGLRNFGFYYGSEVDVRSMGMMSHNAVLTFFAEAGLLGGLAFLAVCYTIGRRPWRALHRPGARAARPGLHAATAGLLGALVALLVSNIFYDFSLRTFVWVFAGLAIAAARLMERDPDPAPAAAPAAV
jgi:O-antigen ligase